MEGNYTNHNSFVWSTGAGNMDISLMIAIGTPQLSIL